MSAGGWLRDPRLHRACELVVGVVFAVAALSKIGKPSGFAMLVSNYELFPAAANLIAIVLPWIEIVVALALVAGVWTDAAARVAGGLTAIFLAGMTSALARGLEIDCGCFGEGDPLTPLSLVRDALILGLPLVPLLFFRAPADGG